MTQSAALHAVLAETRALAAALPDIAEFAGNTLDDLPYCAAPPHPLPITNHLATTAPPGTATTKALRDAILAAIPHATWAQSYTMAQVGAQYLANYGYFNLISPDGPFVSNTSRVSIGYWGPDLIYPPHAHRPEELYCVLAGTATFRTDGRNPVSATPGTCIHHPSNITHGFDAGPNGVLLIAFWRGEDLLAPSKLGDGK